MQRHVANVALPKGKDRLASVFFYERNIYEKEMLLALLTVVFFTVPI